MRIIAIDPGYDKMGLAVLEEKTKGDPRLIFSDCVRTDKKLAFPERLAEVTRTFKRAVKKYRPKALAIEKLYFFKNQKTAMAVAEVRGAIIVSAKEVGLSVFEYTPLQVKIAVAGYGRADKRQVLAMTRRLIRLPSRVTSDDEIDAIAVGLTCLATYRKRISTD